MVPWRPASSQRRYVSRCGGGSGVVTPTRSKPSRTASCLTAAVSATRSTVREECYTRVPVLIENLPPPRLSSAVLERHYGAEGEGRVGVPKGWRSDQPPRRYSSIAIAAWRPPR